MKNFFTQIHHNLWQVFKYHRKTLLSLFGVFFILYSTYPMVRSATESLFIDIYGASSAPKAWLMSVFALMGIISLYNYSLARFGLKKIYAATTIVTFVSFLLFPYLIHLGFKWLVYPLYVWKECYMVLLIHLSLAYCNEYFSFEQAKVLYGPMGAIGSIGTIIGGAFGGYVTNSWGTNGVFVFGGVFLFLSIFFFSGLNELFKTDSTSKSSPPLNTLGGVKSYVISIIVVVALSQFCINIVNFEFKQFLGQQFLGDLNGKTRYLSFLYSAVGAVTLIFQAVVVPVVLTKFKHRSIHLLIPVIYFLVAFAAFGLGALPLVSLAITFLLYKALDYSIFSSAKEMLYFSLESAQKVGAKYLTDMMSYRFSKALISCFLIFVQNFNILNILLVCFFILWILCVFRIFALQAKLTRES